MKPEIFGDYIIFKEVVADEEPLHPLNDCDGMGKILSFCTRHSAFDKEAIEKEMGNKDKVMLSYFEHGLCLWGVAGTMNGTPDFEWDGVEHAGLWIPDNVLLDEAKELKGKERQEKMREWAAQACEEFTAYCNGNYYLFVVQVFKVRKEGENIFDKRSDYRFDEEVSGDSCSGFIGSDAAEKEMEEAVERIKKELTWWKKVPA